MNYLKRFYNVSTKYHCYFNLCRPFSKNLYEPDYLEAMKSKIPLYDVLNVQLTGYDYSVLENYQKLLHNLAKNMDINVEECWSLPPQVLQITNYKPRSEVINTQCTLNMYQRTIQVTDISSLQLPILLQAIEASTPAGVTINIVEHEDYYEEVRYIPDKELISLKQELDDMGGARKK